METALFLGLTSGGACLISCGPLAAALFASGDISPRQSGALLAVFLSGRLLGYLGWAVLSWVLGWAIYQSPKGLAVFAAANVALGAWLIYYGTVPVRFCNPLPRALVRSSGEGGCGAS
jgi:sulfite exporter TauE/SafE